MRRISFSMTWPQHLARTKLVTRRMGWLNAKPGQLLQGVQKAMGLKKGERHVLGHVIELVDVRREPLDYITPEDVVLEGFPEMTPEDFVHFYAKGHRCTHQDLVTRLEFAYRCDDRCARCLAKWRETHAGEPWRCGDCGARERLDGGSHIDGPWRIARPGGEVLTLCKPCFDGREGAGFRPTPPAKACTPEPRTPRRQ